MAAAGRPPILMAAQCPACKHDFDSPDEDPFCSSCVDAGWDLAFKRGAAAARAEGLPIDRALFKAGDIVVSRVTGTHSVVHEIRWTPTYFVIDYQGYGYEYGAPGDLPSCELALAPQVTAGSAWYPRDVDEEWIVQELGTSKKQDPEGYVMFVGKPGWYDPEYVRLNFTWIRDASPTRRKSP